MQIGGSEGGRRVITGTSMQSFRWQVPQEPSARLIHPFQKAKLLPAFKAYLFRLRDSKGFVSERPRCFKALGVIEKSDEYPFSLT
jgi:hypothetical protein